MKSGFIYSFPHNGANVIEKFQLSLLHIKYLSTFVQSIVIGVTVML